jgi:hypothetical protein
MQTGTTLTPSGRISLTLPKYEESEQVDDLSSRGSPDIRGYIDNVFSINSEWRQRTCPLVWKSDKPWLTGPDLRDARELTSLLLNRPSQVGELPNTRRIEWSTSRIDLEFTDLEVTSAFKPLTEETAKFLLERDLQESAIWLQITAPKFFEGASLEIDLLPAEDGEDSLLALRVYGSIGATEFRNRRQALCTVMLETGHRQLYEVISIFQRRVQDSGWQMFSWYSAVSSE